MHSLAQLPILIAFVSLLGWTIAHPSSRFQLQTKPWEDWMLDGAGLCVQGLVIPVLQVLWVTELYQRLLPAHQGALHLSPILSFVLSFVLVDYLYYWNHRGLHGRWFWKLHRVHHTVTQMDVLGTSRNTLWSSFFIVYLWINPLFLYLLQDSTAYLLGVSLTAALDLWRHSSWRINSNGWCYAWLAPWLVLPQDHAWHHSTQAPQANYGANLKLWDYLHGTYDHSKVGSDAIGIPTSFTLFQKLWFPFP